MSSKSLPHYLALGLVVLGCFMTGMQHATASSAGPGHKRDAQVNVDLARTHPVSDKLYGIFFEEINNAGEGGLYAEMIMDRSFDALARTTGFSASNASTLSLTPQLLDQAHRQPARRFWGMEDSLPSVSASRKALLGEGSPAFLGLEGQPQSWFPWINTTAVLTKQQPLNAQNPVAMLLTASGSIGGITNTGFWGISVLPDSQFHLTIYLADPEAPPDHKGLKSVRVALESEDGLTTHASATFNDIRHTWGRFETLLGPAGVTDTKARLSVSFHGPGSLLLDMVSLFPAENVIPGLQNPKPWRKDLLQLLKDLKPRFVRFPGGCYVEGGDWLKDAFRWKTALGAIEERPGHWNGPWGYWSSDGLGLFEYMQLADELGTEPVWVINNGISHREDTPIPDIKPWVQDGLDSIEFCNGPADSKWGSVRAAMGREKPWNLTYFAIGNEDCGHPSYVGSYIAFFFAIRAKYPHMRLIANCNMGTAAPTDLWDWHVYVDSWDMFNRQNDFNAMVAGRDPPVFASEYAVVGDSGWGNLRGAVGEAGFMTGLDRNSEVVELAAYAPLFVNANARTWKPNLIVFDNYRSYGIPSYHVQKLFAETQGVRYATTWIDVDQSIIHTLLLAASTSCQDPDCQLLAVKVVNIASFDYNVTINLAGLTRDDVEAESKRTLITGPFEEAENSFTDPLLVSAKQSELFLDWSEDAKSEGIVVHLPPFSVSCLHLSLKKPHRSVANGGLPASLTPSA